MSYGKLFSSTFTGSMVGLGPDVFAVWAYVVSHAREGQVEMNPILLAAVIGMPVDRVEAAIVTLCAPDARSRNKDKEGRKLVREGEFAYEVVSHSKYREMRNEDDRREYNRDKMRESRARRAGVPPSPKMSLTVIDKCTVNAMCAQSEAEAEADSESETKDKIHGDTPTGCPSCAPESPPKGNARLPKADIPDQMFTVFWDAYDKKEGRKPAFSSWKRLSKADQQAAIDGIPEYHRNVRDRQYRKQAQGYLTQRLWENEYPADSGQIPWGQPQEQSDPWAKPTHIAPQSPETKAWLAEIEAGCKEHDRAIALADAAQAAMHATRRAKERPPVPQTVDPSQDEALNG